MKIEIDIDIEEIVREEVRTYIKENLIINNISGNVHTAATASGVTVRASAENKASVKSESSAKADTEEEIQWEYAPKFGSRRNKVEIALHEKELAAGRLLTPEEKGVLEADMEMSEERQLKAKEDARKKARIDEITAAGLAAADKELAEEAAAAESAEDEDSDTVEDERDGSELFLEGETTSEDNDSAEDTVMPGEETHEIPKTEKLDNLDSLFA